MAGNFKGAKKKKNDGTPKRGAVPLVESRGSAARPARSITPTSYSWTRGSGARRPSARRQGSREPARPEIDLVRGVPKVNQPKKAALFPMATGHLTVALIFDVRGSNLEMVVLPFEWA